MRVQVVAAACVVTDDVDITGIADSKSITEENRELIYEELVGHPGVIYATFGSPQLLSVWLTAFGKRGADAEDLFAEFSWLHLLLWCCKLWNVIENCFAKCPLCFGSRVGYCVTRVFLTVLGKPPVFVQLCHCCDCGCFWAPRTFCWSFCPLLPSG